MPLVAQPKTRTCSRTRTHARRISMRLRQVLFFPQLTRTQRKKRSWTSFVTISPTARLNRNLNVRKKHISPPARCYNTQKLHLALVTFIVVHIHTQLVRQRASREMMNRIKSQVLIKSRKSSDHAGPNSANQPDHPFGTRCLRSNNLLSPPTLKIQRVQFNSEVYERLKILALAHTHILCMCVCATWERERRHAAAAAAAARLISIRDWHSRSRSWPFARRCLVVSYSCKSHASREHPVNYAASPLILVHCPLQCCCCW